MNNYTIDNFELESILEQASGSWSNKNPYCYGVNEEGHFSINYSGILSFLIRRAGNICKSYASDLFITWSGLTERLQDVSYTGEKLLFGFRECGVDSNAFVLSRLNNYGKEGMMSEIKELYILEIKAEPMYGSCGEVTRVDIEMKLGKAELKEEE